MFDRGLGGRVGRALLDRRCDPARLHLCLGLAVAPIARQHALGNARARSQDEACKRSIRSGGESGGAALDAPLQARQNPIAGLILGSDGRTTVSAAWRSNAVSIHGPIGLKVSVFFARQNVRSDFCQRRSLTSLPMV